jgi:hypothetical protein
LACPGLLRHARRVDQAHRQRSTRQRTLRQGVPAASRLEAEWSRTAPRRANDLLHRCAQANARISRPQTTKGSQFVSWDPRPVLTFRERLFLRCKQRRL